MDCSFSPVGLTLGGFNIESRPGRVTKNDYFIDYYIRLKELAINEFQWENLPETCNETILELTLYEMGYALFFLDTYLGIYLNSQALLNSQYNMYFIPPRREAFAVTGQRWACDYTNSVIVFNNRLRTPTDLSIRNYAYALANIRQSIDINVAAMRTPKIGKSDKENLKEIKRLYRKIEDGDPAIFEDKSNTVTGEISVLDLSAPEYYEKLEYEFSKLWRQALTFLGINNVPTDKKERLVEDEVNSNNEEILSQRMSRLNSRQEAAEKINKLFGLNLSVKFRDRGGEGIGTVYNGTVRRDAGSNGTNETGNSTSDKQSDSAE